MEKSNQVSGIRSQVSWFERLMDGWRHVIQVSERTLVDNVAATVPWLAPIAPAFMVWDNAVRLLGWPEWVAWMVAGAVEGLGISVISTAFTLWKEKRNTFGVAIVTTVFYLATVISVNVLLDLGFSPIVAKGLLSLLSIPGAVTIALRTQNAQLLEEAAQAKAERREDRWRNKVEALELEQLRKDLESSKKVAESFGQVSESFQKVSHGDWRNLSIVEKDWIRSHSRGEVEQKFQITSKTAGKWMDAVANNGYHTAEAIK
jgi:hypothetical protein